MNKNQSSSRFEQISKKKAEIVVDLNRKESLRENLNKTALLESPRFEAIKSNPTSFLPSIQPHK